MNDPDQSEAFRKKSRTILEYVQGMKDMRESIPSAVESHVIAQPLSIHPARSESKVKLIDNARSGQPRTNRP